MKVALRDDDTSFFTAPERLHAVYGDVWDRIPVCLATVPFAIGYPQPGIPEEHWHSGRSFPLEQNGPLVTELKRLQASRRVTVALHGYTHQDYPGGYEFQAAPDPERRVNDGLAYLQQLVGASIRIFVPPHNALSRRGLAAVSRAGLNLLGSFLSFRPSMRPWEWRTLPNYLRIRRFRAATGRRKHDRFVYPFVLRYGRHAEFGCHSLIPGTTFDELKTGFDEARALGGHFCIATHYWEVDCRLHEVLVRTLDYAAQFSDVRFVAAEELFA
jgi:peptidoglycan/xylan/chitin deacetylase (PgdA/CDA1 family)